MSDLPEPMTPSGSRGRDIGAMPFDSDGWLLGDWLLLTDRQKVARLSLMVWSWNSNPVASIPNDIGMMWRAGRESKGWWRVHHEVVIRPWVLCSDGRLYHPWLSAQANQALRPRAGGRDRQLGISQSEWQRRRAEVFLRDDYTCSYCNVRGGILECDHVIPLSEGGSSAIENLATACSDCNRSKAGRTPEAWRERAA